MATATTASTSGGVTRAAWAILLGAGGTSVTFNIFHALNTGQLNPVLAYLLGIGPVFVAMCLSHIVAEYRGGTIIKALTFAVMGGAMGLSIGAIVAVVRPAEGPWMGALLGVVLDTASLIALYILLQARGRKAAAAEALTSAETARAEAAAALGRAAADRAEAGRIAAEQAAALELALADAREAMAITAAERDTARTELTAARAEVQGLKSGLNKRRGSGRKPARSSGSGSGRGSGPAPAEGSGLDSPVPDDVDTQAEALRILAGDPEISGSDLGRRLGKSESYGCRLKRELAKSVADPEA